MSPSVTVAIPTSNRLSYLRETVNDVMRQDYPNLDILVSDNASSDGTETFVRHLMTSDSRLRYRRNPSGVPITVHFNQCLTEASGEFFVLLSDDDRISRHFIKNLAEGLAKNSRATVAVPANAVLDAKGAVTRTLPIPDNVVINGIDFAVQWLWKKPELTVVNLLTVMARTREMRKFRYQPFPGGLNCDNLMFLQLALTGQVVSCPDATFFWRDHQTQASRTATPRIVNQSGRAFRNFVRKDPVTRKLISSLPPQQRKLIQLGIRQITTEAFLHEIHFFERPFHAKTVKHLLSCCLDRALLPITLRFYVRMTRRRFTQKMAESRQ